MVGDFDNKNIFEHELLITDTQVWRLQKALAYGSSINIKFSKTKLSKIVQLEGFIPTLKISLKIAMQIANILYNLASDKNIPVTILDTGDDLFNNKTKNRSLSLKGLGLTLTNNQVKDIIKLIRSLKNRGILLKWNTNKIISQIGGLSTFLRPLMTAGLPLIINILKLLAKTVLIRLRLTAATSATDVAIQKKICGSSVTRLMVSNEELNYIIKMFKSLEDTGLLVKGVSQTV